jgi:hypothetical protein
MLVTNKEFLGMRCENRHTRVAAYVGMGAVRVVARSGEWQREREAD